MTKKGIALGLLAALKKALSSEMNRWIEGENPEYRVKIGQRGMSSAKRDQSLKHLREKVPTMTANGTNYYLLHRTFDTHPTPGEDSAIVGRRCAEQSSRPSCVHPTPGEDSAIVGGYYDNTKHIRKFGSANLPAYTSWSTRVKSPISRNSMVSAWVPERNISFYTTAYAKMPGLTTNTKTYMNDEDEVIVSPGKFLIHHYTNRPYVFGVFSNDAYRHRSVSKEKLNKIGNDKVNIPKGYMF